MNLRCIIVDDEPIAQNILKGYIKDIPDLTLVETCDNAIEALSVLKKEKIDLMFLDIEMPKINGINFLKTLHDTPSVIFTTAYREFALDSYDLNAVDYLLKPISFERFLKALDKVKFGIQKKTSVEDHKYFKVDRKNVKVLYKDILFIEGLSNYVIIHTVERKMVVYYRLRDLETMLPKEQFTRIHKSYIVNISHIKAYGSDYIEIKDRQLTIGNTYKEQFLKLFKD